MSSSAENPMQLEISLPTVLTIPQKDEIEAVSRSFFENQNCSQNTCLPEMGGEFKGEPPPRISCDFSIFPKTYFGDFRSKISTS